MTAMQERRFNKRKGPDIWVKLIHWFGVCAWVLMALIVVIVDKARPQLATLFDRLFNIPLRDSWDSGLVRSALFLLISVFFLCFVGLIINSKRHRRKDDRYSLSLIAMGVLAALGALFCLLSANPF